MTKPLFKLSDETMSAWQDVLTEMNRTTPRFGSLTSFGYANKFERCFVDFYKHICISDGMENMSKERMLELLLSLGMEPALAKKAAERWVVEQARMLLLACNHAMMDGRHANHRGDEIGAKESYERALNFLDQAVALQPLMDSHMERGICYFHLGQYSEALALFTKGIEEKPDHAGLYRWRAAVYKELGDKTNEGRDRRMATKIDKQRR